MYSLYPGRLSRMTIHAPLLKHNLTSKGYRTIVVLNAEDAIDRIRGRSEPPDRILFD